MRAPHIVAMAVFAARICIPLASRTPPLAHVGLVGASIGIGWKRAAEVPRFVGRLRQVLVALASGDVRSQLSVLMKQGADGAKGTQTAPKQNALMSTHVAVDTAEHRYKNTR